MTKVRTFVAEVVDDIESNHLTARWKEGREKAIGAHIRDALASGHELPDDTPSVQVVFNGKKFEFADLRGLNPVRHGDPRH